ncbi:MAG: hypothetical protein DSM106950_40405 [Stigonema ocellatum SAG 48.90 = DSM 106950]|nr:hypothetical protein [Stigonema ocellatum SAG 48.90 = DSM 106950]
MTRLFVRSARLRITLTRGSRTEPVTRGKVFCNYYFTRVLGFIWEVDGDRYPPPKKFR